MRTTRTPHRRPRRPGVTAGAVATVTTLVVVLAGVPAHAEESEGPPEPLTLDDFERHPSEDEIRRATRIHEPWLSRWTYELGGTVRSVEVVETEGDEVVVTLASDLLFDVDSDVLSAAAGERVAELVQPLEDGAALSVEGHTDSVASDEYNQDLSERRAAAVADAVRTVRPDLVLEVTGYGESRLKVRERGDDVAEARAQNRRVELRYAETTAGEQVATDRTTAAPLVDAEYVPGDEPAVVRLVDDADVVVEHVVEVPGEPGAQIRVGVEEITVRGPVARLRVHFTPLGPVGGDTGGIHPYAMTGQTGLRPQLLDADGLTSYRQAVQTGQRWETETVWAQTSVDQPLRYETYFARPVTQADTLDVTVIDDWPRFEDVPVVWD